MLTAPCCPLKLDQDGSRCGKNLNVVQNSITSGSLWQPLGIKPEGNGRKAKKGVKALKQERAWHWKEKKRKQEGGGEPPGGG